MNAFLRNVEALRLAEHERALKSVASLEGAKHAEDKEVYRSKVGKAQEVKRRMTRERARLVTAQLGDGATLRDAARVLGITERQAAYALRQAKRQKR